MKKIFHTEIAKITKVFFKWPEWITVQSRSVFLCDLCDLCVESLGGRGWHHSRTMKKIFHTEIAKITKVFSNGRNG